MKNLRVVFAAIVASLFTFTASAQAPTLMNRAIITTNGIVGTTGTPTPATEFEVDSSSTSSPRGIMSAQFNTGTDGARIHGRKARGTRASPLTVVSGDNLTRWVGSGYDGSNYLEDASIIFGTEGTIASTRVPTNIQFWTGTDAAPSVLTQALILKSDQSATFANNVSANNFLPGYATTATAAGTTTLTVASARTQFFTGTTTQTVTLPVTSTLALGFPFMIVNNSTGAVTINSSGGNTVAVLPAGTFTTVTCILTSGTTAASWAGVSSLVSANGSVTAPGMTFTGATVAGFYLGASDTIGVTRPILVAPGSGSTSNPHYSFSSSTGNPGVYGTSGGSVGFATNGAASLTSDVGQNTVAVGYLKSGGFTRVTADVTNVTATMSNITDLTVAAARITAGTHYTGTIQIFAVDSVNVDGLSFDLGGGSMTFTDLEFGFGAQPTGATLGTVTSTTSTTAITLTVVSTSDAVYTISFGFTCNASGTFIPRFAQTSHSSGTATVRKNSSLTLVASNN